MIRKISLTIFTIIILLVSPQIILAGSFPDSLWIESAVVEPGQSYSVSIYVSLSEKCSGLEIPLWSSSPDIEFDSVTLNGSIAELDFDIGWQKKAGCDSIVIFVFPDLSGENMINPPGGKLCELYFHVDPIALRQTITIDTMTYDVLDSDDSTVLVSYFLTAWDEDGLAPIDMGFGAGTISVEFLVNVEEPEMDSSVPDGLRLHHEGPNPGSPNNIIVLDLPWDCYVTFDVVNILGQRKMIIDEGYKYAGGYIYDPDFSNFSSGFYFYRVMAGELKSVKRFLLMK